MGTAADTLALGLAAMLIPAGALGTAVLVIDEGSELARTGTAPAASSPAATDLLPVQLSPVPLNASGPARTSFQPAGVAPSPVPVPGAPGEFTYEGVVTGLPSLPDGLAYQGWLVRGTPLTGGLEALGLSTYERADARTWWLNWTAEQDHGEKLVTGVTVEPSPPDGTVRLVVLRGTIDPASREGRMRSVQPFEHVAATAAVDENGRITVQASELPAFSEISYAAWLIDGTTGRAERIGHTPADTNHTTFTAPPGVAPGPGDRITITVEDPGGAPERPSGLRLAQATLSADDAPDQR